MPPWHLKSCNVDTSLINYVSKYNNPELLKNLALEKIENYRNSVHIYADASKTPGDETSAAFCVPELNIQHGARTTDNITIFAAELTAIKLALMWVMNTLDEDVSIVSDSYSSLQAITSGKTICRPNLLLDILNLVTNYNKNIRFVWLPSHIGIKGNELADKLANSATANSGIEVDVGLELSEAYNLVDSYIIDKWLQIWDNIPTGSHYRTIEKKQFLLRLSISTALGAERSCYY